MISAGDRNEGATLPREAEDHDRDDVDRVIEECEPERRRRCDADQHEAGHGACFVDAELARRRRDHDREVDRQQHDEPAGWWELEPERSPDEPDHREVAQPRHEERREGSRSPPRITKHAQAHHETLPPRRARRRGLDPTRDHDDDRDRDRDGGGAEP
jgi:hypothetical protein